MNPRHHPDGIAVVDLADMVIHRLFGVGLIIRSAAGLPDDADEDPSIGPEQTGFAQAVEELDLLIQDLRMAANAAGTGQRRAAASSATQEGSMDGPEALREAFRHVESAAAVLDVHEHSPQDGPAWCAVETAQRSLRGASIALSDSSLRRAR